MTALFDVNMLLALLDRAHVHHERAKSWVLRQSPSRWASCPITQNGFIRVISQPSYPSPVSVSRATAILEHATRTDRHEFWADSISLLDDAAIDHAAIHGPKQVTDAYLLALAVRNGGRLVALDRSIPLASAKGAEARNLVLL